MQTRQGDPERAVLLAVGCVLVLLFVWFEWKLIFLAFAGLLCALLLHTITTWIERHTRFGPGLSYFATLLLLAVAIVGAAIPFRLLLRLRLQLMPVEPSSLTFNLWMRTDDVLPGGIASCRASGTHTAVSSPAR